MDNHVLFLSKLFPHEMEQEIRSKSRGAMQDSANAFEWKIIGGLDENLHRPLTVCNMLPVGSYPKNYSDPFIQTTQFCHCENAQDINAGFLNLAYIKHLSAAYYFAPHVQKWVKEGIGNNVVIAYSLDLAFLHALKVAKKQKPSLLTCVIVPDMPEFNDLSANLSLPRRLYSKYFATKTRCLLKYVDSFVFMTEQSGDYLGGGKPYIVMEGISSVDTWDYGEYQSNSDIKTIVYTGTTHRQFGIMNLVEAFFGIKNDNYRLVICGCGDSDTEIAEYTKKDDRIDFRGQVRHEQALSWQRSATVLVNPRLNEGEYTKYSFPSKTMEYLVTGVPLVAYKLDGIADEYDEYIIYITDNTIEALRETLIRACETEYAERRTAGERARRFVMENKNARVQTRKIINMLKSI